MKTIDDEIEEAYNKAGHNAYFRNGFLLKKNCQKAGNIFCAKTMDICLLLEIIPGMVFILNQ